MGATDDRKRRSARVPEGRAERIAKLGSMLAGMAGESALEVLRRATGSGEEDTSVLLTKANAERLVDTLADLRGAAMKLGQLLSLQGDDVLPARLQEILAGFNKQRIHTPIDQA